MIIVGFAAIGFLVYELVLFRKESETKVFLENLKNQILLSSTFNEIQEKKSEITAFAVGDIMLDRGVKHKIEKEGEGDYRFPFLKIADDLKKADLVIGNLEGPISDKGEKVGSIYSFRADPKAIEGLKYAGFDILSLANNHMFDYQRIALEDTFKRLKGAGIEYVGGGLDEEEAYLPLIKEIKGTKIGFLAYTNLGSKRWKATDGNSGIAWISEKDLGSIKKDIERAKQKVDPVRNQASNGVDVLIISLHSGEEYLSTPTPFQISFARFAIDAGADLVIGHHPHVVQKVERYKDGWIAYSLGNFVFDQSFSEKTMEGLLLEVIIEDNQIKKLKPKEIKISESFQPYLPR
ncbi:MAG: hypothetical protein COT36_01965 [Parcubacteria group bacterium CG08_land_8_20_14_0_20_38_56]|nr:MAG: hypothetical protein COT36_01965 [Parcubacteria group bacterium CG08_land_8_20_14_0_20_38_56]